MSSRKNLFFGGNGKRFISKWFSSWEQNSHEINKTFKKVKRICSHLRQKTNKNLVLNCILGPSINDVTHFLRLFTPPPYHPFYHVGLWCNVTLWQIPPPLSGWCHLWTATFTEKIIMWKNNFIYLWAPSSSSGFPRPAFNLSRFTSFFTSSSFLYSSNTWN